MTTTDRCTKTTPHGPHRTDYGPFGVKDCPGAPDTTPCTEAGCTTLVPDALANRCGGGLDGGPTGAGCAELFCGEHLFVTARDGNLCVTDYNHIEDRLDETTPAPYDAGDAAPAGTYRPVPTAAERLAHARQDGHAPATNPGLLRDLDHAYQVVADARTEIAYFRTVITAGAEQLQRAGTLIAHLRDLHEQADRAWANHDTAGDPPADWRLPLGDEQDPTDAERLAATAQAAHDIGAELERTEGERDQLRTAANLLRPADWERKAVDAAADALAQGWGWSDGSVMPARIAETAVRAIIDAGLAGHGGRCPGCGSPYPRTPAGVGDPRCWTCATADQTGTDEQEG